MHVICFFKGPASPSLTFSYPIDLPVGNHSFQISADVKQSVIPFQILILNFEVTASTDVRHHISVSTGIRHYINTLTYEILIMNYVPLSPL